MTDAETPTISMIDLVVKGAGEGNFRSVFPVTSVVEVEQDGDKAFLFTAADTASNFRSMVPIRVSNIISLFSYDINDPEAPAPVVGETVSN